MKHTYLSSNATFIYKWVITSIFFLFFVFFVIGALTFFPEKHSELYFPFSVFLLIFVIGLSPLFFLKKIYYDDSHFYISNYVEEKQVDLESVKEIKGFLFYFYKIIYTDNLNKPFSVIFLPHISEKMANPLGTPKSIEKFKEKIVVKV